MDIIEIKNLNFKYNDKEIFNNFNLKIKKTTFTTIIGLNGSGKSTLIRILLGLLNYNGEIIIDGLTLNKENINIIKNCT